MKKDGIQTRNRKLSSKSKKMKGMKGGVGGFPDVFRPLDRAAFGALNAAWGPGVSVSPATNPMTMSSAYTSPYSMYNAGNMAGFPGMNTMHHHHHHSSMSMSMPTNMAASSSPYAHHHHQTPTSLQLGAASSGLGLSNGMVGAVAWFSGIWFDIIFCAMSKDWYLDLSKSSHKKVPWSHLPEMIRSAMLTLKIYLLGFFSSLHLHIALLRYSFFFTPHGNFHTQEK